MIKKHKEPFEIVREVLLDRTMTSEGVRRTKYTCAELTQFIIDELAKEGFIITRKEYGT